MRISLTLVKSFLDLKASTAEIAESLTLLGIEVDQVENDILTLSLTPNLGHAMSALGIARELSAYFQVPLSLPSIAFPKSAHPSPISVTSSEHCLRYMGRLIEGVRIAPSPPWLQQELLAAGMTPICNAVDITNYILLKYGQPLHAFDADQIEGNQLRIEAAEKAFAFVGLDEVEREIPPGSLYIADAKKPISLAGILGGLNSAISPKTQRIFLQAACYHPMTIRRTSKALSLRTESAIRFEKGVDPNGIPMAFNEACQLFCDLCSATLATQPLDLKTGPFPPKRISCRRERVRQILGTHLSLTEMEEIFTRLGFQTHGSSQETLQVDVPTFRFDIAEEIDLIEEIARIYGYNNLETGPASCATSPLPHSSIYLFETKARSACAALGLTEVLTSDLISPKLSSIALEIADPNTALLQALHAKTEEYSILRPSLLPGLLQVAKTNLDKKNHSMALFEIGRIHFLQQKTPIERSMIAFLLVGREQPHWSTKPEEFDFYALKGIVESFFHTMHLLPPRLSLGTHISFHPYRQVDLLAGEVRVGSIGELHPSLLAHLDIAPKVLFAELDLDALQHRAERPRFQPLPQFPASERDWTVPLPPKTSVAFLFDAIAALHLPLLEQTVLIDLYCKPETAERHATFRFTYRDLCKTLSFEDVEQEHTKLIMYLQNAITSA